MDKTVDTAPECEIEWGCFETQQRGEAPAKEG